MAHHYVQKGIETFHRKEKQSFEPNAGGKGRSKLDMWKLS